MPLERIASAPVTSPSTAEATTPRRIARHRLEAPDLGGVRADVAGDPQEHRVAERQEVDVADQQVERAGEQGEAQGLHDEERIGDKRRDRDQRDHDDEGDQIGPAVAPGRVRGGDGFDGRGHCALPNRPDGRMSSTIAMMTKTTVLDASG